jgi:competence protein ComEA
MTMGARAAGRLAWTLLAALGAGLALFAFGRAAAPGEAPPPTLRLDPNTATSEPLLALPGVGPARARALIEHRPYRHIGDLDARVPGLGPKTTAQLAPHLHLDALAPFGARPR